MSIDLKYPTCWEEVTKEHLSIISAEMLRLRSREDFLFEVFRKINKIQVVMRPGLDEDTPAAEFFFKKKGQRFSLKASILATACEELAFILDTVGLPESPILSVNRKLYDIKFKQYYFADAYYNRFLLKQEMSLICTMYESLTGVKRKSLSPVEIIELKIWWSGLKKTLKEMYPAVLKDGDETDEPTQKSPADILTEILSILNENHPERNQELLNTDVHAVMQSLDNIYTIAKKHDNNHIS